MSTRILQVCAVVSIGLSVGCGQSQPASTGTAAPKQASKPPAEHADPHDIPLTEAEIDKLRQDTATWAVAIEHIQKYRNTIKTETTGGTPAKAHRSLDLLDYVLQWLPEIAQSSNLPKESWQSIGENAQKLRDAFNSVHTNIDEGKPPGYESVATEIDAMVETLAAIKAGESSGQ